MPQVIVPSKFFRESIREIYITALKSIKVTVEPTSITAHLDASATVNVSEKGFEALAGIEGIEFLSDHSRKGNVRILVPQAFEFLLLNDPTVGVSGERESRNPMTEERKAELAQRRERKAELARLLAERYGIGDSEGDESA